MTLWFDEKGTRDRFIALCREMGVHGKCETVPGRFCYRITAAVTGKAAEKLTAEWSRRTIFRKD